jgi:hypothetical protein
MAQIEEMKKTSNVQLRKGSRARRPTPNIQCSKLILQLGVGRWVLSVGRWLI